MLQTISPDCTSNKNTPLKKHNLFLKDDISTVANSNKRNSGSKLLSKYIFSRPRYNIKSWSKITKHKHDTITSQMSSSYIPFQ